MTTKYIIIFLGFKTISQVMVQTYKDSGLSASSVEVINHVDISQNCYFKSSGTTWVKENILLLIVVEDHNFEGKFTQIMSSTDQLLKLCKEAGFELKS